MCGIIYFATADLKTRNLVQNTTPAGMTFKISLVCIIKMLTNEIRRIFKLYQEKINFQLTGPILVLKL